MQNLKAADFSDYEEMKETIVEIVARSSCNLSRD